MYLENNLLKRAYYEKKFNDKESKKHESIIESFPSFAILKL